jgi:acetyl-CoA C-acetyltransferase
VASGNMGDDPTLMLNAPVPSARKILDRDKVNVNGGAMAPAIIIERV